MKTTKTFCFNCGEQKTGAEAVPCVFLEHVVTRASIDEQWWARHVSHHCQTNGRGITVAVLVASCDLVVNRKPDEVRKITSHLCLDRVLPQVTRYFEVQRRAAGGARKARVQSDLLGLS